MSVEIPEAAQMLLELVVGSDWPDGDEDALRALSGVWSSAATQLQDIQQTASALAAAVGEVAKGAAADAFAAFWAKNIDDGCTSWGKGASPPILPYSVSFCQQMAKACDDGALEIETAKEMVIGQLLLLAAELAGTDVLGMFTFGLADLGDIAEVAATRLVCKEILNEAVTKVVVKLLAAAIEMGVTQGVLDLAIQSIQVAEHRRSFSGSELLKAAGSGALAGALGAGFGLGVGALGRVGEQEGANLLGRVTESKAGTVVTAMAGGGFTNASLDLAENGQVSLSDLTKGSLGAAIGAAHGLHTDLHLPDAVAEPEIQASAPEPAISTDGAPAGSLHTVLAGLDTHFNPDGSVHQTTSDTAAAASAPAAQVTVPQGVFDTSLSGIGDAGGGLSSTDGGGLVSGSGTGPSVASDSTALAGTGAQFTTSADSRPESASIMGGLRADAAPTDVSLRSVTEQAGGRAAEQASFAVPGEDRSDTAVGGSSGVVSGERSVGADSAFSTGERTGGEPATVDTPREDTARASVGPQPETLTGDRAGTSDPRTSAESGFAGEPLPGTRRDGATASEPSLDSAAETSTPMGGDPRPVHGPEASPEADGRASTGLSGMGLTDTGADRASDNGAAYAGQGDGAPQRNQESPAGGDSAGFTTGGDMNAAPQPADGAAGAGGDGGGASGVVIGTAGRGADPARAYAADGATRTDPSRADVPGAESRAPESAIPAPTVEPAPAHDGRSPAESAPDDRGGDAANTAPFVEAVAVPVDVNATAPGHDATASPLAGPDRTEGSGQAQDSAAQPPRDPRPPLSALREVRPGRQGLIDPADQARVELRFPRDEQGNPLPFRDPRENLRILASNDGGPLADPFRGNNCADQAAAEMENWFGNPQVSAPRFAEYVDGEPSLAPEDGANQKIEALVGLKLGYDGPGGYGYQHLAERLLEAGHGAAAVVVVDWGNGSGHGFNAFNHEGTILWTDGQVGNVSENTPLWPQAKEVWSVAVDADRNPLPGYEPLDDGRALPEAAQSPQTPEPREQAQTPQAQPDGLGGPDGETGGAGARDAQPREDGRPSVEERSQATSRPAEPGARPTHDREHGDDHADSRDPGGAGSDTGEHGRRDNADLPGQNTAQAGHHVADAAVAGSGFHGHEAAAVVDAARQAAALTRTDSGGFAPEAVDALLDGLPSLPDTSRASIGGLVEKVYAGDVRLELLDGRAQSRRPVYRAFVDGELVGFVKVVPHANEFAAELSAADRLRAAGLSGFHTPDVLAVATVPDSEESGGGVLFSSEAPGVSVDALLRRVPLAWDRESALTDLHSAVTGVAEGLAELHGVGDDRPASPEYLMPHADAIREHLRGLADRREVLGRLGIDLDRIHAEAERVIASSLADPGPAGLAHGDAHLGNFLWDEHAGVSLIDAPSLHASMDAEGDPIGSPARDFALFDQRIEQFGSEFGLTPDQIVDLRREFAEAYAREGGPVVPEHVQALFEARAAAHRLARAVQRFVQRPDDVRNGPAAAAAGAALQHALGIDDSAARRIATGFAGELPGAPEFRRDWVAIDNFRSYMRRVADPEVRARFETEFAGRITEIQRRQSEAFKTLWKDLFPGRIDESELSPEGGRRAEELLGGFSAEADGLVRELSDFAAGTGIPALAPDAVRGTIDREGTVAWEASLRETQAKINKVIENVTYQGHEVGFIGSMKTGWRGAHKGKTHFDPHDFDVDLYVVVDHETLERIAAAYPELDYDGIKLMPSRRNPPDLVALAAQIGRVLKEQFPDTPGIENSTIALRSRQPW